MRGKVWLLILAPTLALGGSEPASELDALLTKLQQLRNVFTEPASTTQNLGAETIYAKLNSVTAGVYGANGSGSVILDGWPWETGERRDITSPSGNATVELLSVSSEGPDRPGVAEFAVGTKDARLISVELRAIDEQLETIQDKAGWLIGASFVVTADPIDTPSLTIRVEGREYTGKVAARSTRAGLTLIQLDSAAAKPIATCSNGYTGQVIVTPLHREPLKAPSTVLGTPPEANNSFLVGAMATTPDGRFLGIVGKSGLLTPADLGLSQETSGSESAGAAYARRAIIRAAVGRRLGPPAS